MSWRIGWSRVCKTPNATKEPEPAILHHLQIVSLWRCGVGSRLWQRLWGVCSGVASVIDPGEPTTQAPQGPGRVQRCGPSVQPALPCCQRFPGFLSRALTTSAGTDEERLKGVPAEERLKGLSAEERKTLKALLDAEDAGDT